MCGFCLCSRIRHENINQTQWLKSHTHLKGTVTSQVMESSIINVFHIGKNLIRSSRMLGVVHVEYVHYHHIDDLRPTISLGMECSQFGELGVQ